MTTRFDQRESVQVEGCCVIYCKPANLQASSFKLSRSKFDVLSKGFGVGRQNRGGYSNFANLSHHYEGQYRTKTYFHFEPNFIFIYPVSTSAEHNLNFASTDLMFGRVRRPKKEITLSLARSGGARAFQSVVLRRSHYYK
jgi:hypothetical protein